MLSRYVRKVKHGTQEKTLIVGYLINYKVFLRVGDTALWVPARKYFGLTRIDVRKLAYESAVKNNLETPSNWRQNCVAGEDWF